jgi:hypothetical protein
MRSSCLSGPGRRNRRVRGRPPRHYQIERLEPRQLMSTVMWTGGGDGYSWGDGSNWYGTAGEGADLLFTSSASVSVDGSVGVASITVGPGVSLSLSYSGESGPIYFTAGAVVLASDPNGEDTSCSLSVGDQIAFHTTYLVGAGDESNQVNVNVDGQMIADNMGTVDAPSQLTEELYEIIAAPSPYAALGAEAASVAAWYYLGSGPTWSISADGVLNAQDAYHIATISGDGMLNFDTFVAASGCDSSMAADHLNFTTCYGTYTAAAEGYLLQTYTDWWTGKVYMSGTHALQFRQKYEGDYELQWNWGSVDAMWYQGVPFRGTDFTTESGTLDLSTALIGVALGPDDASSRITFWDTELVANCYFTDVFKCRSDSPYGTSNSDDYLVCVAENGISGYFFDEQSLKGADLGAGFDPDSDWCIEYLNNRTEIWLHKQP